MKLLGLGSPLFPHRVHLEFSVIVSICGKEKFLWWRVVTAFNCGYRIRFQNLIFNDCSINIIEMKRGWKRRFEGRRGKRREEKREEGEEYTKRVNWEEVTSTLNDCRQLRTEESWEWKQHTNWLSSVQMSALKSYREHYTDWQVIFRNMYICVYAHMYVTTINGRG